MTPGWFHANWFHAGWFNEGWFTDYGAVEPPVAADGTSHGTDGLNTVFKLLLRRRR